MANEDRGDREMGKDCVVKQWNGRMIEAEEKEINDELMGRSVVGEVKAMCFLMRLPLLSEEQGLGNIEILTSNKGLIKEEIRVVVKEKVYEVSVVEEMRDIIMLDLQDGKAKGDDERYDKGDNDMHIDKKDGDEDGKSDSDEWDDSDEEDEGGNIMHI
uniref:Transposon TX1 n=1 Tax=Tanacetum cinerariifolium TaxID=118510 RepID=A0A699HFP3_TANCI|nr:transposon TX1 [Tanacetum cinerariifolium]